MIITMMNNYTMKMISQIKQKKLRIQVMNQTMKRKLIFKTIQQT